MKTDGHELVADPHSLGMVKIPIQGKHMNAIEIFAGTGGLGLGVGRAGFDTVDVVEWNRWCCETLRENRILGRRVIRDWPLPRQVDVRELSFSRFEDKIDLVAGGPPCQPFSLGGRHQSNNDSRDMWSEAVRVVRETRPKAFLFENVKGLTRSTFRPYFSYVFLQLSYPEIVRNAEEVWVEHLARLERHHTSGNETGLCYQVLPPKVLNAADYGVPQRRERVFFVGFRKDLGIEWSFPEPTHSRESLLKDKYQSGSYWERHSIFKHGELDHFQNSMALLEDSHSTLPWKTTRDAIGDLPNPKLGISKFDLFSGHTLQPGARSYPGHTGSVLDEPAKTLKAGVHGVPGGENMLRMPDGSVRYFTIRECARLQTFPDDFVFMGPWTEAMRQLGNAVPVHLAEILASSVRRELLAKSRR